MRGLLGLVQIEKENVYPHALCHLFIKCKSILPTRFIESSAGVSKYKQNNEC